MKKLVAIIILICFVLNSSAQIKVRVDERYELVSITFALAGVPQFCDIRMPSYKQSIVDDLSILYELTEPIHFVRKLHQEHAISFDAVSTAASMLEIKNGKIRLNPKYKIEQIAEFDKRWTVELFDEYIKQLNVFYKQSKFGEWFKKHRALYDLAEQRFNKRIANTSSEWFESFFGGQLNPDINFYISLVNGPYNYSTPEGILLGVCSDQEGQPTPDLNTMPLLIHEIAHHYVNPLVDKCWAQMESPANKIYPHVKDQMSKIAYSNAKTTMVEWLNNLSVLMYGKETNDYLYRANISQNIRKGFIWMQRSVDFMGNFYANREKYQHVEDFMPQLIAFLDFTADNFDLVKREIENAQPYIVNVFPALNSDLADAKEVVVTFSEPMAGSFGYTGWPSGMEPLRIDYDSIRWSEDKRQCIIPLLTDQMESGKTYGLTLNDAFRSSKDFPIDMNRSQLRWIKK